MTPRSDPALPQRELRAGKSVPSRRDWLRSAAWLTAACSSRSLGGSLGAATLPTRDTPYEIGTRRELFVDHFLIDQRKLTTLELQRPILASPLDAEGIALEYGTIIQDGDLFRIYTRDGRGARFDGDETEVTRYAESHDGLHWTKPELGLHSIDGSSSNNVILHEPFVCHNFAPFLDTRANVPIDQRFKALAGVHKGGGLVSFGSADGIHWRRLEANPVITSSSFAFDSQNVSFWSESEQCYCCYFRSWQTPHGELRTISRTTSSDYVHWSAAVPLHPNFVGEHLYTSGTHPYFRAPHIYVALPTRFHPERGESTDILFMTARGNAPYDRTFREAFIRPGLDPLRWGNRSNYAAWHVVPTGPNEMSIYTTPFRRFTLRIDGFASLHAGADFGEMVTRPLKTNERRLCVNFATSAGGSLRVELQDESGVPLPGYALADAKPLIGDALERVVAWNHGEDLSPVVSRPFRLRFVMQECDVYSMQFVS